MKEKNIQPEKEMGSKLLSFRPGRWIQDRKHNKHRSPPDAGVVQPIFLS